MTFFPSALFIVKVGSGDERGPERSNPNETYQESEAVGKQFAIYKSSQGVKLEPTNKKIPPVVTGWELSLRPTLDGGNCSPLTKIIDIHTVNVLTKE